MPVPCFPLVNNQQTKVSLLFTTPYRKVVKIKSLSFFGGERINQEIDYSHVVEFLLR